jgi:hypothetical protein
MEDFLMFVVCLFFAIVGLIVTKHVWKNQYSPYRTGTFMAAMVGENGRHGYDAAVSLAWVPVAVFCVAASIFNWPLEGTAIAEIIRSLVVPSLLGSGLLLLSELLFLRPRFLVPPHLRDKRGWIPEWIHSMRNRRSG